MLARQKGDGLLLSSPFASGCLSLAGSASMSTVACDDRISLYPAAPFRLATLLHAWTIAQEGRGSSLTRQTGWPDLRIPITATPPTRPTHPKERWNRR